MGRVEGKVALVTGGASGLGKAAAVLLAREGAKVAASDLDAEGARATAAEIGEAAIAIEHDVTDEAAWTAALKATETQLGGLHILVNSAGIVLTKSVEDTSFEEWRRVHAVDLDSVFLGCRAAVPVIARSGGGSIVNISSISGIIAGHNLAAYNSAKAGVRLLSKSVALHCARKGYDIRCNSIHPSFIETPMLQGLLDQMGGADALPKFER